MKNNFFFPILGSIICLGACHVDNASKPQMTESRETRTSQITRASINEIKEKAKKCNNKPFDQSHEGRGVYFNSPIMAAARKGDLKKIKELLKDGADPNAMYPWDQPHAGHTVLGEAVNSGSKNVIRELLLACASPDAYINSGINIGKVGNADKYLHGRIQPLLTHAISRNMDIEIIKMLIFAGADVNAIGPIAYNENITTPLIVAAAAGLKEIVALLLEAGANKNYKNRENKSALDYAREFNHAEVIKLLQ